MVKGGKGNEELVAKSTRAAAAVCIFGKAQSPMARGDPPCCVTGGSPGTRASSLCELSTAQLSSMPLQDQTSCGPHLYLCRPQVGEGCGQQVCYVMLHKLGVGREVPRLAGIPERALDDLGLTFRR